MNVEEKKMSDKGSSMDGKTDLANGKEGEYEPSF